MAQNTETLNLGSGTFWNGTNIGTFPWKLSQDIYVPMFCHWNFGTDDPISGYFVSTNIAATTGVIYAWDTPIWYSQHTNCRAPLYLPAASMY
jgi:hypothetical protein